MARGWLLNALERLLALLGRFLDALGRVSGSLGHLLAGLWRLLDAFLASRVSRGLDFGRFWGLLCWVVEDSRGML